jgi:hypothetical protein
VPGMRPIRFEAGIVYPQPAKTTAATSHAALLFFKSAC